MNTTQLEQMRLMALRFRQSGKTTMASQLEAIISDGEREVNGIDGNGRIGLSHAQKTALTCNQAAASAGVVEIEITPAKLDNIPDYVAGNGEVELLATTIIGKLNTLLTGPTGCGKTNLVEHVAKKLRRELFVVQGGAGATYERIIAKDTLCESNGVTITSRQLGILPLAMKRGAILYIDEPNSIPPDVLFYLFPAMDYRRTITFDNGESLKAEAGFVVVGAMNEGSGYSGTALLNHAFRSRCEIILDLHYLSADREARLIQDRTELDADNAARLANSAKQLRDSLATKQLKTPIGTRALLAAATLMKLHVPINKALEVSIVNQTPAQYGNERKAVSDVMAAHFGATVA